MSNISTIRKVGGRRARVNTLVQSLPIFTRLTTLHWLDLVCPNVFHRFSRRLLWMSVLPSNNNPKYVAQLYIDFVKEMKGNSQQCYNRCFSPVHLTYWILMAPPFRITPPPRLLMYFTGVPRCIRADRGTENVLVADIQRAFRSLHEDDMFGERSFLFGKSTTNQVCYNSQALWSALVLI